MGPDALGFAYDNSSGSEQYPDSRIAKPFPENLANFTSNRYM